MSPHPPSRAGAPRSVVLRSAGDSLSLRIRLRPVGVGALLLALVCACSAAALSLGDYLVPPGDLADALLGRSSQAVRTVVVEWRLPRVLAAAVFGAALGISGAVFQSLTRNPLGSPDVIGFNTGAYTGVLFVMLWGGSGYLTIGAGALAGGVATALAVYVFAFRRGVQGFRFIIVGIAVSAILTSLNTWLTVKADVGFALHAAVWGAGTLNGVTWPLVWSALAVMAVLCAAVAALAPRMRQLELGDDTAAAQGLDVERTKVWMIVVGVAFTALVTAAAGPVAFVALAAPQVALRLTRAGSSVALGTSALVGAVLLSGADLIAQHAFAGMSLPVGAVTVCVGGLYLLWLLAREAKRS